MYAYIGLGLHQTRPPHEFIGGSSLPSAPVRKYPPIHRPSPLPGKFLSLMGSSLHPQLARGARTPRRIPHPRSLVFCYHLTARAPVNRGLSYNLYKLIYFETAANGVDPILLEDFLDFVGQRRYHLCALLSLALKYALPPGPRCSACILPQ